MAFLASGCGVIAGGSEGDTIVVAADLELTGDGSALGTIYQDALQLRVDQVNEQGLLGDRELELRVTDNRSDPATATLNIQELSADSSVTALVTGQCAACVVAAAESVESVPPTISLTGSDEAIESEYGSRIFKLGPNADHDATLLANEMRLAGVGTIAVVATAGRYGEDGQREMRDAAERAGLEVVVTEEATGSEESVQAAASAVLAYQQESDAADAGQFEQAAQGDAEPEPGPDAVVMWVPGEVARDLAVALRDGGYQGGFFLDAYAADELFLTGEASEALDGARMVFTETLVIDDVIATSPAKAARQTWFRDYLVQKGTYHAYASLAADAIQLIVESVNRFDSVDPESIRSAIEATQTEGLTGPLRMTAENHSGLMPQALTTVIARGGRWRPAG
jgi:branched-chain amino acid transport system substrate-binding protein